MTPNKYRHTGLIRMLLFMLVLTITAGCVHDDQSDCYTTAVIYVSVANEENRNSSGSNEASVVDNTNVYIFNEDSQLERVVTLSRQDIENRKPIEITYRDGQSPQVVVWGNLNGAQQVTEPTPGMEISSARIQMLERDGYSISPDKLYYGSKRLTMKEVQEVVIATWVGRISVMVRGINDGSIITGAYYFTIESKYNGYDFHGHPQAGNALLRMEAEPGQNSGETVLIHQPVNIVAYPVIPGQRESITIRLYKRTDTGDVLMGTADTDIEGNEIATHPGENTNVLLDFTGLGNLNVYLKMTPWGYLHQWVIW